MARPAIVEAMSGAGSAPLAASRNSMVGLLVCTVENLSQIGSAARAAAISILIVGADNGAAVDH